jgi:excisionase family DNA binding protein
MKIDELYTPAQAARLLNVEAVTVRRYIQSGWLRAFTSPTGRYQIPHSAIEKYLDECTDRTLSLFK